jgi:hypothetical protein
MKAVYKLKPYEVDEAFFKTIKELFNSGDITITIEEEQDETDYLLSNEANRKHLLESVEAVKQGKTVHTLTLEEAEALAQ